MRKWLVQLFATDIAVARVFDTVEEAGGCAKSKREDKERKYIVAGPSPVDVEMNDAAAEFERSRSK